ncbi:MAG: hypothetical protein E7054_00640 [Lentisphaerae bacterium]|nr:hypothetical protein [Lentisphaerota bacterium]
MNTVINEKSSAMDDVEEKVYYDLCVNCGQKLAFPEELLYKSQKCPNCGFDTRLNDNGDRIFRMNCFKCGKETWARHSSQFVCVHCGFGKGVTDGRWAFDPTRPLPPTPWKDYILTFLGLAAVIALAIFALPFIVLIIYMFIYLFFLGGGRMK